MKTSLLEEVLDSVKDALAHFVVSLPARDQILIVREASLPFLKNLDDLKAYCSEQSAANPENQDEEDDQNTVVNGEVPEDVENNVHNPEAVSYTHLTLPTICSV